jgi:NAD(P)-dependent dehydrogenase (short-subunit alcohol dehydrogenase family)
MESRFAGKVAIVTGSTSGIGKATALRMAREGAAVCVVANRNAEGGALTVRQIEQAGGQAIFVQADVGQAGGCRLVRDKTVDAFGRVDILVNNAGITRGAPLEDLTEEFYHRVMDTNLKSAFFMSHAAIRDLLAAGGASVTMVSSVHAQTTRGRASVYAATKAAMCGMTRALAIEFGARGVRFNCILPGTIDIGQYPRDNAPVDLSTWKPRANDIQVLNRLGSPDEVAAVICFLSSQEASFVNGAVWAVDGGLLGNLKD